MTPEEQRASELRANYQRSVEALRNDRRLTEEAKAEGIAEARGRTNASLAELYKKRTESRRAERARLERSIFAAPASLPGATVGDRIAIDASFRDALDRAKRTSIEQPEELMELATQAEVVGDRLQSRAALVVAFDRGHVEVINAWTDANPGWRNDVERLWEVRQIDLGVSLRGALAEAMAFASV